MLVNPAAVAALDRITERAGDVRMAFTPGAFPGHDDVATDRASSVASLDPLCAAAPQDAYFVSAGEHGRPLYTRDGCFSLREGTLVGENGRAVLGYAGDGRGLSELHVDPVDVALGRTGDLRVDRDGSIEYTRAVLDPRTGAREHRRVVIGRLALARFAAGTRLQSFDANHFTAPPDVAPHVGRPGDGNFANLEPMRRETSRVDLDRSLMRLQEAYLEFEALQAAHKAQGDAGKTIRDLVK